jgi:uncharacterized membrane protein YbaN (DUF454 family)
MSQPTDPHRERPARTAWGRGLWAGLGVLCVAVGLIGVVLPGLPTTPFLILAAACFLRSSQELYDRVLGHPRFGPLVRDFREGKGLPLRVKVWALALMWIFVLFALGPGLPEGRWELRAIVGSAAVIGTAYLIHLPTRPRAPTSSPPQKRADGEGA